MVFTAIHNEPSYSIIMPGRISLPLIFMDILWADYALSCQPEGNAVKVVPIHAELTTQEAADMLNVSRPHLVKLLEGGALPFHKTGKHRRIRFADLMSFKAERDRASARAMEELAKQAQELQLGYE